MLIILVPLVMMIPHTVVQLPLDIVPLGIINPSRGRLVLVGGYCDSRSLTVVSLLLCVIFSCSLLSYWVRRVCFLGSRQVQQE